MEEMEREARVAYHLFDILVLTRSVYEARRTELSVTTLTLTLSESDSINQWLALGPFFCLGHSVCQPFFWDMRQALYALREAEVVRHGRRYNVFFFSFLSFLFSQNGMIIIFCFF
ncbi:unnamed protein product [Laminaria digitata]